MWIVVIVVIVAVVLIALAGRQDRSTAGLKIAAVSEHGLHPHRHPDGEQSPAEGSDSIADQGSAVIPWPSIFEVTVMTRRELGGTWFGFELQSEGNGLLLIDGPGGLGQDFLAQSHRFPGFDHDALTATLERRSGRAVCYSR